MARRNAELVDFNTGDGTVAALVLKDHGDSKLDLAVLTASGVEIANGIPRRDPKDYGHEGGGRTWH